MFKQNDDIEKEEPKIHGWKNDYATLEASDEEDVNDLY